MFKYGEIVRIKRGFYEGLLAKCIGYDDAEKGFEFYTIEIILPNNLSKVVTAMADALEKNPKKMSEYTDEELVEMARHG